MIRSTKILAAAIVALASTAGAQDGPVGAYTLQRAGQKIGSVMIQAREGGLVLTTHLSDGTARPVARRTQGKVFTYDGQLPTAGLAGALTGTATPPPNATWTVELAPLQTPGSYKATIKANGAQQAEERLVKVTAKAGLFVPADAYSSEHMNAFKAYATQTARRYGFARTDIMLGDDWQKIIQALLDAEKEGRPYDRVIFVGHGGWDGPILGHNQVSSTDQPELFAKFVDAVRRGTKPDAKLFSSSCHSGGSNKYEAVGEYANKYRWTDDVADLTGRTVAGPMGYTSTEFTEQNVFAALEGQGVTKQEVRVASAAGVRTIGAGGTLAGSTLKPKEPVVRPTPTPPTPPTNEPTVTNTNPSPTTTDVTLPIQ